MSGKKLKSKDQKLRLEKQMKGGRYLCQSCLKKDGFSETKKFWTEEAYNRHATSHSNDSTKTCLIKEVDAKALVDKGEVKK